MNYELFATTDDGIELRYRHVLDIHVWFTFCQKCEWQSPGFNDKAGAVVLGAMHECEISEVSPEFDAQFGAPLKSLDNLSVRANPDTPNKKPVGRPRKS